MNERFYTIDQVAELLDLHHKTIRKFIAEGRLKGVKVGRQWRVSESDLKAMTQERPVQRPDQVAEEPVTYLRCEDLPTYQVAPQSELLQVQASLVVDAGEIDKEQYIRISNTLLASANVKHENMRRASVQTQYDERLSHMKVILWGDLDFIGQMLATLKLLIEV